MTENSGIGLPVQICVVGETLIHDRQFVQKCQSFGLPVTFSSTGEEHMNTSDVKTVYVVAEFCGPEYDRLAETKQHILGPPAIRDLSNENRQILVEKRPIFCLALSECYIIFTGYRKKADLERLLKLIHTMGGSVGKEVGVKMTHLIATSSMGEKYQYATTFSVPVLTEQWLHEAWDNRHALGYRANDKEQYKNFKVKPFMGNSVCFYGFDSLEEAHMKEVLVSNGGKVAGPEGVADPSTTHLVVDENNIESLPPEVALNQNCVVVKAGWFWDSIQIEAAADVKKYVWRDGGNGILSPNRSVFSPPTPSSAPGPGPYSANRRRKRKHREEMIRRLASVDTPGGATAHKRRSSVSEAYLLSTSGSFLDKTDPTILSPEKEEPEPVTPIRDRANSDDSNTLQIPPSNFNAVTATARRQVFHELVTTESNYVDILACICGIRKEAEDTSQRGGAVLDEHDLNIIFADVAPIFNLHVDMLKKLKETEKNWKEDVSVGQVIVQFADAMLKAYPPFVNFFERTRTQIEKCDKSNMRFHAVLKNWERKPESSRQPLKELMIRPVQRLPSLSLLLSDLLKHTRKEKDHPDAPDLEKALERIKEVMSNMNEEKRKTEGQITLFDIYNEIQDCPASIVNSHRSFICRNEVIEVAADDAFCGKGYELTLFLFTDMLVVAKKKSGSKGMGMIRSPSTASISGASLAQAKPLKFVKQIPLNAVKRLVEVMAEEGAVEDIVALVCRLNEDLKEKCYTLQILNENTDDRTTFLKTICRHVANTLCRPDPESLLVKMSARELSFDPGDLNVSTFSRAFSSFLRNKQKVGRKFSFNKTPNKLRRAVSTMLSPSGTLPLGYHSSTPSDSMKDLRLEGARTTPRSVRATGLQSCVNLLESDSPRSTRSFPRSPSKFLNFPSRLESPMRPPPESPRRLGVQEENRDPDQEMFRTPTLCKRPSIRDKFRSGSFSGFRKNHQNN